MEIKTAIHDEVNVISISGSLDGATAPQAQEQILPNIASGCCLVLDFEKCVYISSAGLRVLLMIAKQLPAKNGCWAFAGLSAEIKDVMDMTGFSSFFSIFDTVAEAVASVKNVHR
ncbi:MAG: STAS domain-containing protein [Elusimicrobia bacterium]|nr:STAS domain-containing protein [Elusimicrobiota bacterium]